MVKNWLIPSGIGLGQGVAGGPLDHHRIDQAEGLGFIGVHETIALHVLLDDLQLLPGVVDIYLVEPGPGCQDLAGRSEEHTSELQSLMRSSYAVFCLKKKKNRKYLLQHNIQKKTQYKTNH